MYIYIIWQTITVESRNENCRHWRFSFFLISFAYRCSFFLDFNLVFSFSFGYFEIDLNFFTTNTQTHIEIHIYMVYIVLYSFTYFFYLYCVFLYTSYIHIFIVTIFALMFRHHLHTYTYINVQLQLQLQLDRHTQRGRCAAILIKYFNTHFNDYLTVFGGFLDQFLGSSFVFQPKSRQHECRSVCVCAKYMCVCVVDSSKFS